MSEIDPILLAVLNGRLVQIADEMDATLYRSAFNPIIAEAHDACHGLYHAKTGATLVQGTTGLPIFVGAMAFAVKAVIDKANQDSNLQAGDTYLFNDPYDGGTHLNDFRLVRPLFSNGKLFAWLASVGHWLDVGGNVPGNFNAKATESFQEGFRIPPVKLARAGIIQQDIVDILGANSRVPQSNWGDLNGQLNALDLGERRVEALLKDYSEDLIVSALDLLTARAEKLMRANIADLPDGIYSYDDFLDNDGITDVPLSIALDLTISGDRMRLDFSHFASLGEALSAWLQTDQEGIIEIADSGTYRAGSGDGDPSQPGIVLDGERRSLTIQAAPQQRPCIQGSLVMAARAGTSNAKVMLDGLLIGGALHSSGAMRLTLRHCTLLPSDGDFAIQAVQSEGLRVVLESAVTAAIRLAADASELKISDSIIDGGNQHAVVAPQDATNRGHGEPDELRLAGPPAVVERTTFVGRVVVSEIEASDTIFTAPLSVTRQHQGFVRHSYVAPGSRAPRRYACQPADPRSGDSGAAIDSAAGVRVQPKFTSLRRGHPGYAQFAPSCPRAISAGASNGAEMGAFHFVDDVRRHDNLSDTLDEHLPIGYRPITIYVT